MSAKTTKKRKQRKAATKKRAESKATPKQPTGDGEEMVVFALRLRRSERDEIHEAAGSGKASRFVKAVALAAARRDAKGLETAIKATEANRKS